MNSYEVNSRDSNIIQKMFLMCSALLEFSDLSSRSLTCNVKSIILSLMKAHQHGLRKSQPHCKLKMENVDDYYFFLEIHKEQKHQQGKGSN